MKKNEKVQGICVDYTNEGLGIVKVNQFPVFVKNILVGEEAIIQLTKVTTHLAYGRVVERLSNSAERVEPECTSYRLCGGCHLQHMSYPHQLQFKTNRVKNCFERIAHLNVHVEDCLGMTVPWKYRNKVQIPVQNDNGRAVLGFYRSHSHDIVEYQECLVQSDLQNQITEYLRNELNGKASLQLLRHVLIKHALCSNEAMAVLIVKKDHPDFMKIARSLVEVFSEIKTVVLNFNDRNDNVILGDREKVLVGTGMIRENLKDLSFGISSKSFYQINPYQTEVLYSKALEFAQLTGQEEVVDVYCGTGTIGLFASRSAKHVTGIEIVKEAVEDAKRNAEYNHITNADFICSDAGAATETLLKQGIHPDVVIVDPPRKGLDQKTIESCTGMNPDRIVYVSCDPATCARDCAIFETLNYHVEKVQPVDMFPHTHHVETVVLLQRK
ncbi:MAG: 23S rRNA (uracil(1939)-C(5))-methyltransferase RlmD [Erysipelotrichaceae bacterium]|nr:23S rRNA (uracil(1939)-C(5))-methyltransferase RlmD [Erysipelotrichaceae bacterium]